MRQRSLLYVRDDLLDDRVLAVGLLSLNERQRAVSEHRVVAVGREQLLLLGGHRLVGLGLGVGVQPLDPAHEQPAGDLLAGERGAGDFGDLGVGDQSLFVVVPDRIGVLDRRTPPWPSLCTWHKRSSSGSSLATGDARSGGSARTDRAAGLREAVVASPPPVRLPTWSRAAAPAWLRRRACQIGRAGPRPHRRLRWPVARASPALCRWSWPVGRGRLQQERRPDAGARPSDRARAAAACDAGSRSPLWRRIRRPPAGPRGRTGRRPATSGSVLEGIDGAPARASPATGQAHPHVRREP